VGAIALWLLSGPLMGSAMAQDAAANPIDTGDTAFMLICGALVLLMTSGLAFFSGGLVRSRNILNTMMQNLTPRKQVCVNSDRLLLTQ
jgi:ammonium transporter, Amt family